MANYLKVTFLVASFAILLGYFSLYPQTLVTTLKLTGLNSLFIYVHNKCLGHDWCKETFSKFHGTSSPSSSAEGIDPVEERIFSKEELTKFTGEGGTEVYIALLGKVYNVTKGAKHYGPGGGYSFFAGRDASRAFVSGEFEGDGLNDDVEGLSSDDFLGLEEWSEFYAKTYQYLGKLVGRYYNGDGLPTPYAEQYKEWRQNALDTKHLKDKELQVFPPCNMEWKQETGTRVWCTNASGGIKRDWVGVPRKLFKSGSENSRCACIRSSGPPTGNPESKLDDGDLANPNVQVYEGCEPTLSSCFINTDE